MAFTDDSDLFATIHEVAINRVVQHIMRQRPSLFNYGTELIARNPDEWLCEPVDVAPAVIERNNPIVTVESPLPIFGTNGTVGLNFCFQLVNAVVDLHPGKTITLPSELSPPLTEQYFAIEIRVCAGLGCPSQKWDGILDNIEFMEEPTYHGGLVTYSMISNPRLVAVDPKVEVPPPPKEPTVIPTRELECFCLNLFVVGHLEWVGSEGNKKLVGKVDGLEIVDITPEGLENNIECYLHLLIQHVILPRTSIAMSKLTFEIFDLVALKPTMTVSHNPAIEEDQIKAFIDLEVLP